MVAYRELVTHGDAGFTTAGPAPDVAAIRAVIASATPATDAQLARALGTDEARVAALAPHLSRSGQPFDDLALLGENLALADQLGVSGEALGRMVDESDPATTFDQLSRAADDVLGAFRAKYPDPQTLTGKLEPYEDIAARPQARRARRLPDHPVADAVLESRPAVRLLPRRRDGRRAARARRAWSRRRRACSSTCTACS